MRTILVIDDCEHVQLTLGTMLTRSGYRLTFARDAAEALAALERGPADLALLDVGLPGVSGLGLLAVLRAHPTWKDLPVIVVTARGDAATRAAARTLGAGDYLIKSHYSNQELLSKIRDQVSRAA